MKKIILASIAILFALTSCKKDDTLYYNNWTMANIVDGNLVSDQGNTFDIVEAPYEVNLESFSYGRVILLCDILRKTSEQRYDIRLNGIGSVLTKNTIKASQVTPESEAAVDDPIIIQEAWYGGGYINMYIEFVRVAGSDQKHLINLIYEDTAASDDGEKTYSFTLRHNAFGENPAEESILDFELSGGYVSFPVASLIKEDKAKITLNWNTYSVENGNISWLESKEMSKTYDWSRMGFEQSAATAITPSLKLYRNFSVR